MKGLTLKIGMHVACERDSQTETLDYYGPGVTMAAKLLALHHEAAF